MSKPKQQTKAEKAAAAVDAHAIETQLAAQEPENIVPFPEVQEPGEQEPEPEAPAIENAPEGEVIVQPEAPLENAEVRKWNWPEAREHAAIRLGYTDHEKAGEAEAMSNIVKEREALKTKAKNVAADFKAKIDTLDEELAGIADRITEGGPQRNVLCDWVYEAAGLDENGAIIYHPEKKTLIHWPSVTVVKITSITPEDMQASLDLPVAEAAPEGESYVEPSQDVPDSEGHADPKECPSCGQIYDPEQVTVEECNRCQVPGATACCMPDGAGSLCTGCRAGEELPPVGQEPAELEEED